MSHSTTGRSGLSSDEADDGLGRSPSLVVLLEELGRVLLHRSTDLTNDDDTLSSRVVEQDSEGVDVGGSGERVSSDTNDERLTETDVGGLGDSLVVERSRSRDDSCG